MIWIRVQQTRWCFRSQVRNFCRFPEHSNWTVVLSKQVALFQQLDLWSLVGLVGSLLLVELLLDPIPSSNHVSKKSLEEVEVTKIFSRKWLLQFPSEQLSGYNKLGVFREEWWRSIASDRTSILSFEQDWCRPNTPCLMFLPCFMLYCARWSCSCVLSTGSTSRKNTVCLLLKFCPPGINPELMIECELFAHPTW